MTSFDTPPDLDYGDPTQDDPPSPVASELSPRLSQRTLTAGGISDSSTTVVAPVGTLPAGGTTGQMLVKESDQDYDTEWSDSLPSAGPPLPLFPSYTHRQSLPATIWTVIHNLGFRPNVQVVDSAGTAVIGDLRYLDDNTVRLTFSVQFAGEAYLS